jgi:stage II sporulation protein D
VKSFIIFIILLIGNWSHAQQLRIGVLRDYKIQRIIFSYNNGSYTIIGDTTSFGSILQNEFVDVSTAPNGKISLKKGVIDLGTFSKVFISQNYINTSVILTSKSPVAKERKYKDDFEITNSMNGEGLNIINLVDINNYLAGVIESEGGPGRELEYYKVQALMSRTYAMKYNNRHAKEGFDLCDRVHCQAYHNMMKYTPIIDSAVNQTKEIVMMDTNGQLLDAYFHSNCGGQTSEPEIVWNKSIPYLNSFKDTFCIYAKQATWEKRISQYKWQKFLIEDYNYPFTDSIYGSLIFTFNQPERMAFYQSPVLGIPLRDLREHFGLKSTYFSCYPEGNEVVIKGKGFGHGVGLCQEGAMKMSKYGYNYLQIAQFYFPNVLFKNIVTETFFRQEIDQIEY